MADIVSRDITPTTWQGQFRWEVVSQIGAALAHGGGGGVEERVADGANAGTLRPGVEESAARKGKERRPQGQTSAARALRGRIHVGGLRSRANRYA